MKVDIPGLTRTQFSEKDLSISAKPILKNGFYHHSYPLLARACTWAPKRTKGEPSLDIRYTWPISCGHHEICPVVSSDRDSRLLFTYNTTKRRVIGQDELEDIYNWSLAASGMLLPWFIHSLMNLDCLTSYSRVDCYHLCSVSVPFMLHGSTFLCRYLFMIQSRLVEYYYSIDSMWYSGWGLLESIQIRLALLNLVC